MTSRSNDEKLLYGPDQVVKALPYETDRFYLQIGRTITLTAQDTPVYQIVNKVTLMIEGESVALTDALYTLGTRTNLVKDYETLLTEGFPIIEQPPTGGTVH
jgi:hypothetical protein